jgi:NAD(P)-dependent dehydrogenase (short-subunit alcohol dehydrogenase family)
MSPSLLRAYRKKKLYMTNQSTLKGKVAFVTGGTKGIGFGIAQAMLEAGMKVGITGRSQDKVDQAVSALSASYGEDKVYGWAADVRDAAALHRAVADLLAKTGKLDVVVANAGVGHFAGIEDLSEADWQETIDVNLTGVFHTVKATLPAVIVAKGYYITIASLAGTNFFAGGTAYNASKFGLVGFTQAMMMDLRKHGVKVTTIMPGSVATEFNDHVPTDADHWKIQSEDIGQMTVDLLRMHPRTLPSKVEVRPTMPPGK